MSLNDFYREKGFQHFEGHSGESTGETEFLKNAVKRDGIVNVMEIGFNAGHSADTMLSSNPAINLTSFDLGNHEYSKFGKEYIDQKYPGRHTLINGDSRETVPKFINKNNKKFDLIFVDGGHEEDIPFRDMQNAMMLAHRDTIVILDDVRKQPPIYPWNIEPNRVWHTFKVRGLVQELEQHDYEPRHGLVSGKFCIQ